VGGGVGGGGSLKSKDRSKRLRKKSREENATFLFQKCELRLKYGRSQFKIPLFCSKNTIPALNLAVEHHGCGIHTNTLEIIPFGVGIPLQAKYPSSKRSIPLQGDIVTEPTRLYARKHGCTGGNGTNALPQAGIASGCVSPIHKIISPILVIIFSLRLDSLAAHYSDLACNYSDYGGGSFTHLPPTYLPRTYHPPTYHAPKFALYSPPLPPTK